MEKEVDRDLADFLGVIIGVVAGEKGRKLAGIVADVMGAARRLNACTHGDFVIVGRARVCLHCGAMRDMHEHGVDWSRPVLVAQLIEAWGRT